MSPRHCRRSPWKSSDLFTGRVSESETLATSLSAHRTHKTTFTEDSPARNVLVFHGLGGIGKSTLSVRLEDWITGRLDDEGNWGNPPLPLVTATARIDLHASSGTVDPVFLVLVLRRALNALKPRWPAFDLALATWWAAARPGDLLPNIKGEPDPQLNDAVIATLADVLSDLGAFSSVVNLTIGASRKAVTAFTKYRNHRIAADIVPDQEWFRSLLQRMRDLPSRQDPHPELLIEAVELLDAELAAAPSLTDVVVFIDSFEKVQIEGGVPRQAELTLHELIWNLPHVLFVITGRNSLNWADGHRLDLRHPGPNNWPGLIPNCTEEPRQHQVGDLSPADTRVFLRRAREAQGLPLDDVLFERIVEQSGGVPVHLDFILMRIRQAMAEGHTRLSAQDISGSLDELVDRFLRDIPHDERRVLRAAALFSSFDAALLAAASGEDVGTAMRALKKPMIESWDDPCLPFRMHDTVRRAIRYADPHSSGGWAEDDWQKATSRALQHFKDLVTNSLVSRKRTDALRFIGAAITLVCAEKAELGDCLSSSESQGLVWLSDAIRNGPGISVLSSYVPASSRTACGQGFLDFIRAMAPETRLEEKNRSLESLATSSHPISLNAARFHLYGLRAQGRFDAAVAAADRLVRLWPNPYHRFQRRLTLSIARRFSDSVSGIDEDLTEVPDRIHQIRARAQLMHGCPFEYQAGIRSRIERLQQENSSRLEAEVRVTNLINLTISMGRIPSSVVAQEITQAEEIGVRDALKRAHALAVLNDPLSEEALLHLEALNRIIPALGRMPSELIFVAKLAHAWANGDNEGLAGLVEEFRSHGHLSSAWIRDEMLVNHLGFHVEMPPTQWLEPFDTVKQRWGNIWEAWWERSHADQGEASN